MSITDKPDSTAEHIVEPAVPPRTWMDYIGLGLRGAAMGAADVVPGVSGGTMAFILGIYEELLNSIKMLAQPETIKTVVTFQIKKAYDTLPWRFLLAVFVGIIAAAVSLAPILEWLLENEPIYLWSFFFGLVLASILVVTKRVGSWHVKTIGGVIIGTVVAYLIVGLVPVQTPEAPWFLFLSGMIAICAMILPGISGSFILVLLGKYQFILAAVNDRDLLTLAYVGAGAAIGIVSIAQVLSWLFKRYHDVTVAVLIGFMAGSLRKIWPWKDVLEYTTDRHGELVPLIEQNIMPPAYDGAFFFAVALMVIGFAVVFALDWWAAKQEETTGAAAPAA